MNCAGVIAPRPPIFLAISTPKSAAVAMTSASKSCSRGLTTADRGVAGSETSSRGRQSRAKDLKEKASVSRSTRSRAG